MFGSVGAWFYTALAGINPDPVSPGFRKIRIEPQVVRDLRWASGSAETPRGQVASSWSRDGDRLRLEVVIPVGSEAEIILPKLGLKSVAVTESGKPVWAKDAFQAGVAGVTGASQTDRTVVIQAGSGRYVFETEPQP
jgi:alpha-L-rhamnosidase